MQKAIIFTAYNGAEIIDPRPEAEIIASNEAYAEERYNKQQAKLAHQLHSNKHPFAKVLANAMGLF